MKILLPCVGLEHIQRGFETFSRELFIALRALGQDEVHLAKATGEARPNEAVVGSFRRDSRLWKAVPARFSKDYYRFQVECYSFAIRMVPLLRREKFDLIHFSEVPLGHALRKLRRTFGFKYRLLLSNGAPYPPHDCLDFDFVHQVSPAHQQICVDGGVEPGRQFLVPYGINGERLQRPAGFDRASCRRRLGIPENAFVVLSLAALNIFHKRIDWLVKEFAGADCGERGFLLLAGNRERETPQIEELAHRLLPRGNWAITQVGYDKVPELLWSSDVLVQASLDEGFGRVLVEAMGARLPVLSHAHDTAKYLISASNSFVDMEQPAALANRLKTLQEEEALSVDIREENLGAFRKFEWRNVAPQYSLMYRKVLDLSTMSAS